MKKLLSEGSRLKKLLARVRTDRAKLLLSVAGVVLVILAAMLLPLAFRTDPETPDTPDTLTLEARTQLFADYWSATEPSGFTVEKPDPVPRRMKETCETVMRTLIARFVDDQNLPDATPTGSEYTVVTDAEGRELHLCRMWLEARGDWQNWLDVFLDADSGELYYFYLSRECLTNRKNYPLPELTTPEQIAELIASENGWTLRRIFAEADGSASAVYSTPGGTVCVSVSARVYDALIDVKISCQ